MSEIEEQSFTNNSDLYKGPIEINNNTPKGIVHDKDNVPSLNSFTNFPLENAAINQTTKESHSDIPEQPSFVENNLNVMTKFAQSEQITYTKFSSGLQQKEISVGEQQEIDNIQPTSKNEINPDSIQNIPN